MPSRRAKTDAHNEALKPILNQIIFACPSPVTVRGNEADQWVLLESLCLGIGLLHRRDARAIATFVENIAERIASGERTPLR